MNEKMILWVYSTLLLFGGVMGFVKGKSKVSLIMAFIFSVLLDLCAMRVLDVPNLPQILIGVLIVIFAIRLAKTKKFMPSGMMLIVSALALVALLMVK
jgi:uncharacterized membrane protein (UPF0136 family)